MIFPNYLIRNHKMIAEGDTAMIHEETYQSLKDNLRGSFAIWGEPKRRDRKDVDDLTVFSNYEAVKRIIKPNIIFVGMNLAGDATKGMKPYSNFHSSVVRHNDYRLRDAIVGTPFEGGYMTDFFKPVTSISDKIGKHYRAHPAERQAAIEEFVAECRSICEETKYLICIGTGYHYETIMKALGSYPDFICRYKKPTDIKKPCFYIPHYSGAAGKSDEEYHRQATEQLLNIEKEIFG